MERAKKTIGKVIAVIALAVAMLLCCVLIGCGLKDEDELDNQVPIDTIDTDKENNDGEGSDRDKEEECVDRVPDIYGRSYSGLCIKTKIEEKEEYNIEDGVSVDLLYGVDIGQFNYLAESWYAKDIDEGHVYVSAFNTAEYHAYDGYSTLGDSLREIETGKVKDGALLIDEISCTITNISYLGEKEYVSDYKFLNVDNLQGTEYEGNVKYNPYEITCYKKASILLPRELFIGDEGRIAFGIYAFIGDENGLDCVFSNYFMLSEEPNIYFDYKVNGDKIQITNIKLGGEFILDGAKVA